MLHVLCYRANSLSFQLLLCNFSYFSWQLLTYLKNDQNNQAKNCRPTALENIVFKFHKDCMNKFLQDHCQLNNIIRTEQARGKKEVWDALRNF